MTERERLIELVKKSLFKHIYKSCNLSENIADDLLANGVIVLPCKVGDVVYQRDTAGRIYESKIKSIIYDTDCIAFDKRAIGKTVFLTKEEAEDALRKEDEKNDN